MCGRGGSGLLGASCVDIVLRRQVGPSARQVGPPRASVSAKLGHLHAKMCRMRAKLDCSRAKFAAKDDKQNVLIVAKTAGKEDLQDESKRCRAKWAIEICALEKEKQRYKTLKRQQIQTERGEDGNVTRVAKATSPARRDDALCVGGESYPCTHKRASCKRCLQV